MTTPRAAALATVTTLVVAGLSLVFGAADTTGAYGWSVVWDLRWPRILTGLAVGAALGAAGGLMQAVTRNPLADPSILGLNAGAAFALVALLTWFGLRAPEALFAAALVGALAAAALVWALGASVPGGATPLSLTLAGVILTAVLSAWTSALLLQSDASLDAMRVWLTGSLAGRNLGPLTVLGPVVVVALAAALTLARALDTLGLGDDGARSLGVDLARVRWAALGLVAVLTAAAVALAGPLAFVGLVVPHTVRRWVGADQRAIIGVGALAGPALVLGADLVGRLVVAPQELPVGVVTALVGAPLLIALARRRPR